MFSSNAQTRKDPFPYQSIQSAEIGIDYRVSEASLEADPSQRPAYRYLPREKYEYVQHNPTNPILVTIREHPKHPEKWLFDILDDRFAYRVFGGFERELEHAEKVLRKLIASSESEWKIQYGVYYPNSDIWEEYYSPEDAQTAASMFEGGTVEWRKVTKWGAL